MALYIYSQGPQDVDALGLVDLGAAMRCGGAATLDGRGVSLNCPGALYLFNVSATGTTTAAGTLAIQARLDGADVPGATASQTVGVVGDLAALPLTFIVRAGGCRGCRPTVTLVNSGDAATFENVAVTVARIA